MQIGILVFVKPIAAIEKSNSKKALNIYNMAKFASKR